MAAVTLRMLHEVETDHVAYGHVAVFNAAHVRFSDANLQFSQGAELAAIAAGE